MKIHAEEIEAKIKIEEEILNGTTAVISGGDWNKLADTSVEAMKDYVDEYEEAVFYASMNDNTKQYLAEVKELQEKFSNYEEYQKKLKELEGVK